MVIKLFPIVAVMLFSCASCEKELHKLSMAKTPYTGNELRIDGYYYSNLTSADDIGVAVFYRDGVCINTWVKPVNSDTLSYIENEILINDAFINKIKSIPTHIGVFQINTKSIEFETWEVGRDIITFSNYGEILNDTTFLITKQVNNDSGKSYSKKLTYRFRQFSPKPDSTNTFIK
jgi:hypothetical protein